MTVITSEIAIYSTKDGSLILLAPAGSALRVGQASSALPADYTPETWKWDATTRTMYEVPALVEAALVAKIKADGEQRRMMVLTPGGGKKMVYNAKLSEVEAFRGLFTTVVGGTLTAVLAAVAGLPAKDRTRKFRYALAEQALRKESSISPAIGRFEAGADAANAEAARIEAVEQVGTAAIKAATTAAGKRTAYAAINWDWKP